MSLSGRWGSSSGWPYNNNVAALVSVQMPSGLAEYSPQLQIIEQQTAKTRKITSSIGSDARSLLSLSEAVIESETRLQLNQCDYPQMYTCLCMDIGMVIGNDGNVEQRKDGIK